MGAEPDFNDVPRWDAQPLPMTWHGDPIKSMPWLIRNRIPELGAGLLVGQWGLFKSFMHLDIAASVMTGWDWTGEEVYRRGGVLIFAPEGSIGMGLRIQALAEHRIATAKIEIPFDIKKMPIVWISSAPTLIGKIDPIPVIMATVEAAAKRFRDQFDLPLSLITFDTLAACAGWRDENDNAQAMEVLKVLQRISQLAKCAVIGVDHAGKNTESGTRGASAKEDNSDFVLATLGTKKASGEVDDTRLALRKMKEGPQGQEIPFTSRIVDMGQDERGNSVTSRIIDWDTQPKPKKPAMSERAQAFEDALSITMKAQGATHTIAGVPRFAVTRECLRNAFRLRWRPEKGLPPTASDERFRKALEAAEDGFRIQRGEHEGEEWIWRVDPL